ncbi:hypothetical protein MNBD_GAMMA25-1319 [hydrothermal vent metagenome]|uniref:Lipopolysaccharide export system protein LptC n=1 Tax=hydrothermal vent metagenome TaxID=652676 RepID=A0A3B1BCZ2_9ZZZZ
MSRLHYFLTLLFVVILTAFANWLLNAIEHKTIEEKTALRHEPNYFVEGLNTTVFNADGSLHYRLQARRLDHYPDDETLQLASPIVKMFSEKQAPWVMVADEGIVYDNGQRIHLNGAVDITQINSANDSMQLVTRDLRIDTLRDYAQTDAAVKLTRGHHQTTGTGMRAELRRGRLELLADTRGRYDVSHP